MKRTATGLVLAALLTAACAAPRNTLGTSASPCFRALPTAKAAVHNHGRFVGVRRVSRPSLRVYVGVDDIPAVRRGLGVNLLSTPKGILADRHARRENVGGEVICTIW